MTHVPRIALLIETSRSYGREMIGGIMRYARLHGTWSFYITPGDFLQAVPEMKRWGGSGIIARVENRQIARAVAELNLPTIALDLDPDLRQDLCPSGLISEVHPDSVAVAKLAADHLVERSFKRFGFVGFAGPIWSRQRQDAFVDQVKERGYECIVYDAPTRSRDAEWSREQVTLSEWLRSLPKPIGVMCCNDDRGRQVLEAARAGGVVVPEEVAVIGVDNDDLLCDLCDPPLSSVALNASRGGYEAAKLLDGLMSGRFKKPRTIMVEPTWVATRRSTDVLAIEDREVSQALRFIHDHVGRGVSVNELMQEQTISRRALEIRFRKAVGRSIHEEILHARVERAKRLLAETDWSNDRIAEMAGFASGSYMGQALRKALNMTPAQYRTHIRTR